MVDNSGEKRSKGENDSDSLVSRNNGISYVEIPARDVKRSAEFYQAVFTWKVTDDQEDPGFADGSGHVIGHWVNKLPVAGDGGVTPYIYVSKVNDTLEKIRSNGCEVVKAPYREGNLWVATFRDPAGNIIGIWQHGPL